MWLSAVFTWEDGTTMPPDVMSFNTSVGKRSIFTLNISYELLKNIKYNVAEVLICDLICELQHESRYSAFDCFTVKFLLFL